MDVKQIERLMAAMESYGVTELKWSEGEQTLALSRETQPPVVVSAIDAPMTLAAPPAAIEAAVESAEPAASLGRKEVLSPMVGTFHPAPKPVKVGAKLKKGEVLCVVEAMKLMNDIVMEEDGEIMFFALNEGDMVEFGQVIAQYKAI